MPTSLFSTCSFLRRVSLGSCVSVPDTGGKKPALDATNPSPCDVTAFMPITPCRSSNNEEGFSSMVEAGRGGDDALMSPVSRAGGGVDVPGTGGEGSRGRFATDFEVMEVIGAGTFGTVYKVRYASKYSTPYDRTFLEDFFFFLIVSSPMVFVCFLDTILGLIADRCLADV